MGTSESGAIITQTGAINLIDVGILNGSIAVTATGVVSLLPICCFYDSDSNDVSISGVGIVAHKINAGLSGDNFDQNGGDQRWNR